MIDEKTEKVPLTHEEILFLRNALSLHLVEPTDRAVFTGLNKKIRAIIKYGFKVKEDDTRVS